MYAINGQGDAMDDILASFTSAHPCWTRELLVLAGENEAKIDSHLAGLVNSGFLQNQGEIYFLTNEGKARFSILAKECYLEDRPGNLPEDPQRSLTITRLWLYLERCNRQVGGEKDYRFNVAIPVRPDVNPAFALEAGKVRWLWPQHPEILAALLEFPPASPQNRAIDAGSPERWKAWQKRVPPDPAPLRVDLLFLCRYDMIHYLDFQGHPNDSYHLINADRFCFVLEDDFKSCLAALGKYHLWLYEMRHAAIPGYLDVDTQEQGSVNWLIFVTETEKQALELAVRLAEFGEDLVNPAMPMELWTLSLENMGSAPSKKDVIWEVLPFISHAVWPRRD